MAAAYQLPCCSRIHVQFVLGSYQRAHPPLNEVVITVFHRRRRSLFRPRLRIPRPPFHCSPSLFHTSIQTLTHGYCRRHLSLAPCCVDALLPRLLDAVFVVIDGFHGLPGVIPIGLHISRQASSSTDHHDLEEHVREALGESFEGAAPEPTPASVESIRKLVEDNMKTTRGDDEEGWSCMICLEEMETRRSSLKMPCSHVFHRDCIVGWLKSSHLCPLCRYQMPV